MVIGPTIVSRCQLGYCWPKIDNSCIFIRLALFIHSEGPVLLGFHGSSPPIAWRLSHLIILTHLRENVNLRIYHCLLGRLSVMSPSIAEFGVTRDSSAAGSRPDFVFIHHRWKVLLIYSLSRKIQVLLLIIRRSRQCIMSHPWGDSPAY